MSRFHQLRTTSLFQHSSGKQFKIGGYRPDPADDNDKKYGANRYEHDELPPKVDLRPHLTKVEQQGELNSLYS